MSRAPWYWDQGPGIEGRETQSYFKVNSGCYNNLNFYANKRKAAEMLCGVNANGCHPRVEDLIHFCASILNRLFDNDENSICVTQNKDIYISFLCCDRNLG